MKFNLGSPRGLEPTTMPTPNQCSTIQPNSYFILTNTIHWLFYSQSWSIYHSICGYSYSLYCF